MLVSRRPPESDCAMLRISDLERDWRVWTICVAQREHHDSIYTPAPDKSSLVSKLLSLHLTIQSEGATGFSHVQLSDDLTGVHTLIVWLDISYNQVWSFKCVPEDEQNIHHVQLV